MVTQQTIYDLLSGNTMLIIDGIGNARQDDLIVEARL